MWIRENWTFYEKKTRRNNLIAPLIHVLIIWFFFGGYWGSLFQSLARYNEKYILNLEIFMSIEKVVKLIIEFKIQKNEKYSLLFQLKSKITSYKIMEL